MEREDRAREEERAEKLAAKQAKEAAARPSAGPFSGCTPVPTYTGSNRAEKYLPSLPIIQHGEMGKSRVKLENGIVFGGVCIVVGSLDEAYVSEMRHYLKHPNVIEQKEI